MDERRKPTDTTPRKGLVKEVCREWLVLEDGAVAHQLQNQEIAAYYEHNKERNRIVRQDFPCAKEEQHAELAKALELKALQEKLRLEQERADEEAARKLAEELEKEEELRRKVTAIRDEQLARRLGNVAISKKRQPKPRQLEVEEDVALTVESLPPPTLDLRQALSEVEARLVQEMKDAEIAHRLQMEEENAARLSRTPIDFDTRMAMEEQDRELARMLHEKEKARLKRAKEKARLKAEQQRQAEVEGYESPPAAELPPQPLPVPRSDNIAACIDPTWMRRQQEQHYIPTTDLDFPSQVTQPVIAGQRRSTTPQPSTPTPPKGHPTPKKSGNGCPQQ